jgi:hypothetical protein
MIRRGRLVVGPPWWVDFMRPAVGGYWMRNECAGDGCFENFIKQLLHHCRPFPEPNSVLVMDNTSFHHTEQIEQMCTEAGVKLLYLPPYSPDFNPIEEFFTELKAFIKKQ